MTESRDLEYVFINNGKNNNSATTKGQNIIIKDYDEGGFEQPAKKPTLEEIKQRRENLLSDLAQKALRSGYINIFSTCYILAENSEYNINALLKKLLLKGKEITKPKDLIPEDAGYNQRRGEWYFILLRLTTGLDTSWKPDVKLNTMEIFGAPCMPVYRQSQLTKRMEQVSESEYGNAFNVHGFTEHAYGEKMVSPIYIKLSDLQNYFENYLKLPFPERLSASSLNRTINNRNKRNSFDTNEDIEALITPVCPEIKNFYNGLIEEIGLVGNYGNIDGPDQPTLHRMALDFFARKQSDYTYLNKDMMDDEDIYAQKSRRPRRIKGMILQKYLKQKGPIEHPLKDLHILFNKIVS